MAQEVRYDKSHHAGATPEARITNRLRNSGGEEADTIVQKGSGPTRTFTNIHHPGSSAAARQWQSRRGRYSRQQTRSRLMNDDANKQELETQIAALQKRLSDLERAKPPPAPSEADVAKFQNEMHQLRERNASAIPPWMREAVRGGVSDADAQDLVRASRRPHGPSTQSPQDFKEAHPSRRPPGGGTGWLEPTPLSPPPGVAQADRLMDEQDRRDRAALIEQEARRRDYEEQIDREAKLRLALKNR